MPLPSPKKFKDQKAFMKECMHQTLHMEKKEKDQAIAQCMQMWRDRSKKKAVSEVIKEFSSIINKA